jgi:hypothetical protein
MAGHQYVSDLYHPKLKFKGGGSYTMSVIRGHKILHTKPISADKETSHAVLYMHVDEPYDPPTFVNAALYQCSNRPNAHTPSAFTWHLCYACKCASVLKHTQNHVNGLHIRQGPISDLPSLLPCSACLAGKIRKNRAQPEKNYTDIENFTGKIRKNRAQPEKNYTDIENFTVELKNLPLSWTASTANKDVTPNRTVSVDWGIINKKHQSGENNVFTLFLDIYTGVTFVFPAESRGQAGVALQAYMQKYGTPNEVIHDNASEFIQGE